MIKLILSGRIGEAIDTTNRLYPGLLDRDPDLLFALKCRQFVEMVNGSDSEVCQNGNPNQTSVIQSTKAYVKSANPTGTVEEMNINNTINGTSPQFVNGQIEDDVDMEESSVTNVNGIKNSNGYQNGNLDSNGYKCQNGEDVDMGEISIQFISRIVQQRLNYLLNKIFKSAFQKLGDK